MTTFWSNVIIEPASGNQDLAISLPIHSCVPLSTYFWVTLWVIDLALALPYLILSSSQDPQESHLHQRQHKPERMQYTLPEYKNRPVPMEMRTGLFFAVRAYYCYCIYCYGYCCFSRNEQVGWWFMRALWVGPNWSDNWGFCCYKLEEYKNRPVPMVMRTGELAIRLKWLSCASLDWKLTLGGMCKIKKKENNELAIHGMLIHSPSLGG